VKIVYTQENCPACLFAKAKLTAQNTPFREIKIGKDITREDFLEEFPDVRTVPYVIDEDDLK
jgi:glutaredoxin